MVDPATGRTIDEPSVTVEGEGTYTINPSTGEVTFTPDPKALLVQPKVWMLHCQRQLVETNKDGKIQQSTSRLLQLNTHQRLLQSTVTPTDKVSVDVQNVPQTQTPTFELSNDKTAEIYKQEIVGSPNWSTN